MEITFSRNGEHTYSTVARRDDGVLLHVPSYDRTSPLPHDIAHFVVERELGLSHGFWGCVAAGALFPGVKVLDGRQPAHATEKSQAIIKESGQQGTEAEVLVGVMLDIMHKNLDSNGPAALKKVKDAWKPDKAARAELKIEEIQRVCAVLRETEQRWQALATGQSLRVSWPHHTHKRGSTTKRKR